MYKTAEGPGFNHHEKRRRAGETCKAGEQRRTVEQTVRTCARPSGSISRVKHAEERGTASVLTEQCSRPRLGRTRVVDNASARSGTMWVENLHTLWSKRKRC